jgi:hypothetical protein
MERQEKRVLALFVGLLLFAGLACGIGGANLPEVEIPEGAAATAEGFARSAATAAAEVGVAATAGAAAQQAGSLAATAVALAGVEGADLVATLQASDFAINVDVNSGPLQEKFSNLQPDANGNVMITITDAELNELIVVRQVGNGTTELQNVSVAFRGGNAILTGQVSRPVQAELEIAFRPEVEDGRLRFRVANAAVGNLRVPNILLDTAENSLNSSLSTVINSLPASYRLQDITIGEGTMTIIAQQQ